MTSQLETALGYTFNDRHLIEEALTHSSYANEADDRPAHNERLEFLGDAVLELCVTEELFASHTDWTEGRMTNERSEIVRESTLASWGRALGIHRALKLGRSLDTNAGRANRSVIADAVEATLGAVYLDGGIDAARRVVAPLIQHRATSSDGMTPGERKDVKTELQELLQADGMTPPIYTLVSRTGPDHSPTFVVELSAKGGAIRTTGRGTSKKAAAFDAAERALAIIRSSK